MVISAGTPPAAGFAKGGLSWISPLLSLVPFAGRQALIAIFYASFLQEFHDSFRRNYPLEATDMVSAQHREQSRVLLQAFERQLDWMVRVHMLPLMKQDRGDRIGGFARVNCLLDVVSGHEALQVVAAAHQQASRPILGCGLTGVSH